MDALLSQLTLLAGAWQCGCRSTVHEQTMQSVVQAGPGYLTTLRVASILASVPDSGPNTGNGLRRSRGDSRSNGLHVVSTVNCEYQPKLNWCSACSRRVRSNRNTTYNYRSSRGDRSALLRLQ